jgi:AcrR family transcriptional regulator
MAATSSAMREPKKTRLRQDEAELLMLKATTDLLTTTSLADLTVHLITSTAGVHHDYVARYFGSREELLVQAVEHSTQAVLLRSDQNYSDRIRYAIANDNELLILASVRIRLISYLLSCGVSPERFQVSQRMILENALKSFTKVTLSDRTKYNFVLIGTLLMQSMNTMGDVNGMTEQDIKDISSFVANFGNITELTQASLGWE